jgi:pilus assembly protein Flp/PilA
MDVRWLVLNRFLADDSGQGILEYALILSLVAVVAVASLTFLGKRANNDLSNSAALMP